MKIAITGSRGFCGSNLVQELKKEHYIIGLNRNLDRNCHESHYVELSNYSDVQRSFNKIKPDILIHCAAIAAPKPTEKTITNIIDTNIKSALNLSYTYKGPIINFSSIVIYGEFNKTWPARDFDEPNPISLYGITKYSAEQMFNLNSNVIHLRLGNMVGPNLTHGVVIDVCKRLKEEDFYVFGRKPGTIKPYLHIQDVISFIKIILSKTPIDQNQKNNISFNLVNDDTISIEEVTKECMNALGIHREIVWDESKTWAGDNSVIYASNDRAKNMLGWKPTLTSKEAIYKAVKENEHIIYQ